MTPQARKKRSSRKKKKKKKKEVKIERERGRSTIMKQTLHVWGVMGGQHGHKPDAATENCCDGVESGDDGEIALRWSRREVAPVGGHPWVKSGADVALAEEICRMHWEINRRRATQKKKKELGGNQRIGVVFFRIDKTLSFLVDNLIRRGVRRE
jgi:hypothetical protein